MTLATEAPPALLRTVAASATVRTPSTDMRPALSIRVGVTGTRALAPAHLDRVRAEVVDVLRRIRDITSALAATREAAAIYRPSRQGSAAILLQIVSPLAEGADRLVAEEGAKLAFSLVAPLPFEEDEYAKDFPSSIEAFQALLGRSTVIELDGSRGSNETASYEAAGRFVAQNSDILIAVWDGDMTGKRGGTSEITRYAAELGVPIWWIRPEEALSPRWLGDEVQWTSREKVADDAALPYLEAYLSKIVLPPMTEGHKEENLIGRIAHQVRRAGGIGDDPLLVFLQERTHAGKAWPWRSYTWAYSKISPRLPVENPRDVPQRPDESYWNVWFGRADRLSIDYADRYRSSYLLIIFFAFFVDLVAKVGAAVSEHAALPTTTFELVLLLLIALLVLLNHVSVWHERWINYRLLAELCRGQSILSPLGEKLPRPEITRSAALNALPEPEACSREVWVAWFVEALSRAAPWPSRASLEAKTDALGLGLNLTIGQAAYHRQRSKRSAIADRRLGQFGEICFFLTVVAIALRLVLVLFFEEWRHLLDLTESAATSLSAASAAFIAVRFYSEFGMLDRQSQRMERNMEDAERELASIRIEQPLSSVALGRSLQGLSMSMLQDIGGWAELFRIRAVEAG